MKINFRYVVKLFFRFVIIFIMAGSLQTLVIRLLGTGRTFEFDFSVGFIISSMLSPILFIILWRSYPDR